MQSTFLNPKNNFHHFDVLSLPGLTPFQKVYDLQLELLEKRIQDQIPDTILFCEHFPVITRGRGLQHQKDFKPEEKSKPLGELSVGTDYFEIERGGDLTWHGPGQLVMYPIVKLGGDGAIGKKIGQDIEKWIRFLEKIWIDVFAEFGIQGHSLEGGSGVWVRDFLQPNGPQPDLNSPMLKVMSVGIALRRWISFHGVAVNVLNDLSPFHSFEPCGFRPELMTRLKAFESVPASWFEKNWREMWEQAALQSLNNLLKS